jgi:sugar lactone lactonase YvrE
MKKQFSIRIRAQLYTTLCLAALTLTALAFLSAESYAQAMLNQPESVVWDANTRTYLVSNVDGNKGTGSIVRRNANGTLNPFVTTGLNGPKGMVIAKFGTIDALRVVDVTLLKAYNLANGSLLGTYPVPNTEWLFDIAADSAAGVLYLSDRETGIIRASATVSGSGAGQVSFTTIVSGSAIANPNGLSFDRANKRLLAVSFADGAAQIAAINLNATPATVQTLFTTPPSSGGLDGIARDKQGRYLHFELGCQYRHAL